MNRKTLSGAALLLAGGFLLRESLSWAFNRLLDAASSGVRGGLTFVGFSWLNAFAIVLVVVGLTLLLWPKPKAQIAKAQKYDHLTRGAKNIIQRVRAHRTARWHRRDTLEPISDIALAGEAVLLSFAKAGFVVPQLDVPYLEQAAVGHEVYFMTLIQFLARGHFEEAKALSAGVSEQADSAAKTFEPNNWFLPG